MYDALFPEQATQVLNDRIRRPQAELTPEPGAFSNFWTAIRDVVPAAGLEAVRSANTILEHAAKAQAPADEAMLKLLDPEALENLKKNKDVDMDAQLREGIKRFTPDPQQTGWASQIVHGAGKVIGKAVGYGALGGLPGAVAGIGVDEGINETLRLTDQGVDTLTAAKAGAVHGVSTALSVAAPVAGKTIAQTVGLVAASGPGLYMAETASAKAILESADYDEIAKQYDPFDPVGLTMSTLLPAAFGAAAHAGRAKGAPRATAEQVAAAQTVIAADHIESTSLAKPDDIAGMNAHTDALEAIVKQMEKEGPIAIPENVRVDTDSQLFKEFSQSMDEAISAREAELLEEQQIADEFSKAMDEAITSRQQELGESAPKPGDEVASAKPETETEMPKAETETAKADAESPEIAAAKQLLDSGVDIPVKYTDEMGVEQQVTARDLMTQAEDEVKLAEADSKAFDAAITCFLGG